mgnify:CR=1 FL=1
MPISMPSASRACLLGGLAVATAALGQDSARTAIEREGAATLDRLTRAMDEAKDAGSSPIDPRLPAPASNAERRRAFEGLRQQQENPAMTTRAHAAVAAGEAALARERDDQARRLRQALGLEPSETEALARPTPRSHPTSWVPVLFASSSMPISTLR